MIVKNSGQEIDQVVDSAKLWAWHHKVVAFVKLIVGVWILDVLIGEFNHPSLFIWAAV
jgi:hypothetical protein